MNVDAKKPIRILHVVGRMNRGGAETLIMNVYRHIDRDRVQFDFAVHTDQSAHFDQEIIELGGKILPHPNPHAAGFRTYGQALTNTLRTRGPFAGIHSHVHHFSGYILRVAQKAGVPLRLAHSHNSQDGKGNSWLRIGYRWYMRHLIHLHATHMLGCSRAACESLFGRDCWRDPRVRVFPNAIDLMPYAALPSDRRTLRQRLSLPAEVPLIGHVGRFSTQKNHRFLIEIFAALRKELPTAHLVLVGDGPLRPEIEAQIRAKGIGNNVHLLGIRSDVPQIMGALDLFLFPSLYEGLGIVLLEAQAAGLPCVVAKTLPDEADIKIGLVQSVGLQDSVESWVHKILIGLKTVRPSWAERRDALRSAGYDIRQASVRWQEIYIGEQQQD